MAAKRGPKSKGLPSREQILEFVKTADGRVGKREIARAFNVTGSARIPLKQLLRDMADEGLIARGGRKRISSPDSLPPVVLAEVTGIDLDGDPIARPAEWHGDGAPPTITVLPSDRRGVRPPGPGDRVLLRVSKRDERHYDGRIIKVLAAQAGRLVGVYRRAHDGRDGGRLQPADRRVRSEFLVFDDDAASAAPGDLVIAETLPARRLGLRQARVLQVLGSIDAPRAISQLVLNAHGIPVRFATDALAQAEAATPPTLGKRTDLRSVPLVTIDDEDARDFDDAVWAEPDPEASNRDGWHLIVAIADVAHYVRPDDAIDREARLRGNSVYLPDMVVPMLPEALSNGLCSLRPDEDRACLVAHLWIDRDGGLLRHRFERALMRSAARLTYRTVQAAIDGDRSDDAGALFDPVIAPLLGAYQSLRRGRDARGTLDFDLPERRVLFDDAGHVRGLEPRARFDSHRIIEEFMITANVAAAETLTKKRAACMFRIHDQPSLDKLEGLREYLSSLGYKLTKSRKITPGHFNQILKKSDDTPEQETVAMMVLRSQAQAEYSPHNIGHFGLNLPLYAHFTSPIRRYADLLVHRSLIAAHRLGDGGAAGDEDLEDIGAAISLTERRAATAERDAMDRFATRFMAEHVGAKFSATITGVTRFGLFVRLSDTGAEGLIPIRDFGEYMRHDEHRHQLVGETSGSTYSLGGMVEVTLTEADTVTGSLRFELETAILAASPPRKNVRRQRRKRH